MVDAEGSERQERVAAALRDAHLDALICALPENILMLTGYWPVVGTAVAVATSEGRVEVLAPEDERDLAEGGWASVRTYEPGSLTSLAGPLDMVGEPLGKMLAELGLERGSIGVEGGGVFEGSSYAAMFRFGSGWAGVLEAAAPASGFRPGAEPIARLRSAYTPYEVDRIRLACSLAAQGFSSGEREIWLDHSEAEVAAATRHPFEALYLAQEGVRRGGAFAWCMSGPNSALAGAAYARSRDRKLEASDFVLVHCNSYLDGYWTDITRTYVLAAATDRQFEMYDAVFTARAAALEAIRPGALAADVDRAARQVLEERGFGRFFTHGLGHNVGFSVISAEFPPRLHPDSPDRLEVGMTFNIEPAIYIEGYGGMRHCDVMTVREDGPEVLTDFRQTLEDLILLI